MELRKLHPEADIQRCASPLGQIIREVVQEAIWSATASRTASEFHVMKHAAAAKAFAPKNDACNHDKWPNDKASPLHILSNPTEKLRKKLRHGRRRGKLKCAQRRPSSLYLHWHEVDNVYRYSRTAEL